MTDHLSGPEDRRASERVPIDAEVDLQFDSVAEFFHEYAHNLSLGGMFVGTDAPKPQGTPVRFVLHLGDYELRGSGEVAWVRAAPAGPDLPAGMGIRFHQIDPQDRRLIFGMVDGYIQTGGKPFDLDEQAP